jgi:trimeric autotransporter adhesin
VGSAELAQLALSVGALSPAFDATTAFYTVKVEAKAQDLTVTPTAVDPAADIAVNGVGVVSGAPSTAMALALDTTLVSITVTSADGSKRQTYSVLVLRSSASADLQSLSLSAGTLSPTFDPDTLFYSAAVAADVTTAAVTATAQDAAATLVVNGLTTANGVPSQDVALAVGRNFISVSVTGVDGLTEGHYLVMVERALPSADLANLVVSPGRLAPTFAPSTMQYVVGPVLLPNLHIRATAADPLATVRINGASALSTQAADVALSYGLNAVEVEVTTADGMTSKRYAIAVLRFDSRPYVKASNSGSGDFFGYAAALDGDTLAVGACAEASNATGVNGDQDDNSLSAAGAVYVFVRTGSTWTQQAYLKASNTDADDYFGFAVSLHRDTLAVSAVAEKSKAIGVDGDQGDDSQTFAGAVYVFVRTGSTWAQQAYLKASNTDADDKFGWSVGLRDNTLVVGAPFEDSNATGVDGDQDDNSASASGAAYVFTRSGSTWTQLAYLKASNSRASGLFGMSVAWDGTTLAVGAPGESSHAIGIDGDQEDDSAVASGAVYLFGHVGEPWVQQAYIKASNTAEFDRFGTAVALDGDTLVVGAPYEGSNATGMDGDQDNNTAPNSGAAYVFARVAGTWVQQAYVKASNTSAADQFGTAVALDGDTLVVSAPYEDSNATGMDGDQEDDSVVDSGAAYVFSRVGSLWAQRAYVKASNSGAGDEFGWSLALHNQTLVVGADREKSRATGIGGVQADDGALDCGAVYVYP